MDATPAIDQITATLTVANQIKVGMILQSIGEFDEKEDEDNEDS